MLQGGQYMFIPKELLKHATGIQFLLRAISKADTRVQLQCIQVKNGLTYATDGKRLHTVPTEELPAIEPGIYKPLKDKGGLVLLKQEDTDFPNCDMVIPDRSKMQIITVDIESKSTLIVSKVISTIACKCYNGKATVNYAYIQDIGDDRWDIYYSTDYEQYKPILCQAGNKQAVIMPIMLQ